MIHQLICERVFSMCLKNINSSDFIQTMLSNLEVFSSELKQHPFQRQTFLNCKITKHGNHQQNKAKLIFSRGFFFYHPLIPDNFDPKTPFL